MLWSTHSTSQTFGGSNKLLVMSVLFVGDFQKKYCSIEPDKTGRPDGVRKHLPAGRASLTRRHPDNIVRAVAQGINLRDKFHS